MAQITQKPITLQLSATEAKVIRNLRSFEIGQIDVTRSLVTEPRILKMKTRGKLAMSARDAFSKYPHQDVLIRRNGHRGYSLVQHIKVDPTRSVVVGILVNATTEASRKLIASLHETDAIVVRRDSNTPLRDWAVESDCDIIYTNRPEDREVLEPLGIEIRTI